MSKQLTCPNCDRSDLLQVTAEHCIIVHSNGDIDTTGETLDRDTIACANCGIDLRLECSGEGEEERVYWLEKRTILKAAKPCGNCGRPTTASIGNDINRCYRCVNL